MINLQFFGAARTTTGSMHLLEANGKKILLDAGLYQGSRKEAFEKNRQLPIDPRDIDAVLLSHAHIDHCGNLPTLAKRGFRGKIHCTPATADLAEILLRDSVHLQLRDLEIVNQKRAEQGKNLFEPLYLEEDVDRVMRQFSPEPLHSLIDLGNHATAVFREAGHILGSAITEELTKAGSTTMDELASVAQAWLDWAAHPDAWLMMPASEILAVADGGQLN